MIQAVRASPSAEEIDNRKDIFVELAPAEQRRCRAVLNLYSLPKHRNGIIEDR
jgi:hypothetical protein